MRVGRAVHQGLARPHRIALVHADVFALGNQVLARLADLGGDDHLALALGVLAEGDDTVDFADDGELLRLARLEELGNTRQTTGDVLGLGGLARDLGDDVAGRDRLPFDHVDVRPHRQQVARQRFRPGQTRRAILGVLDRDARPLVEVLAVDDDARRQPGALVDLLLHGDAFEDVAELDRPPDLGEHRDRVGIPLRDQLAAP